MRGDGRGGPRSRREAGDQPLYSIGAAAKIIDVPATTLRAWEERYGVVRPIRS